MANTFYLKEAGTLSWNAAKTKITGLVGGGLSVSAGSSIFFDTSGEDRMIIKNDGKVGIGTNDPSRVLDVVATGGGVMNVISSNTWQTSLTIKNTSVPAYYELLVGGSGNGTGAAGIGGFSIHNGTDHVFKIKANGNVGIGTTDPAKTLDVNGDIMVPVNSKIWYGDEWSISGNTGGGSMYFNNTTMATGHGYALGLTNLGTTWIPSDDRLKHNETQIEGALDTIMELKPINYDMTYQFLDPDFNGDLDALGIDFEKQSGFIAQDVHLIPALSDCVEPGDDEKFWAMSYQKIWVYAVKAIQELKQKNDNLEDQVADLTTRLEAIEAHLGI